MSVTLVPGQTMALVGARGRPTKVRMGLGWRSTPRVKVKRRWFGGGGGDSEPAGSGRVDLDASVLLFTAARQQVDQVWFSQLNSVDGSIHHTGDNTTGQGEGDLESIQVDLSRVPVEVVTLIFTVNSYTGQRFTVIESAYCRLIDETYGDEELGSFNLAATGEHTAQIMAKLVRGDDSWTMTAIGAPAEGRTINSLGKAVAEYL